MLTWRQREFSFFSPRHNTDNEKWCCCWDEDGGLWVFLVTLKIYIRHFCRWEREIVWFTIYEIRESFITFAWGSFDFGFNTLFSFVWCVVGHLLSPQRRRVLNNLIEIKANLSWVFYYFHFNVSRLFNSLLTKHSHQRRRSSAARFEFIFLLCSQKTKSWK